MKIDVYQQLLRIQTGYDQVITALAALQSALSHEELAFYWLTGDAIADPGSFSTFQ